MRLRAAADGQDRTVDIARGGGGDERHDVGDLVGVGGTAECRGAAETLDQVADSKAAVPSVCVGPGATAFTRTP